MVARSVAQTEVIGDVSKEGATLRGVVCEANACAGWLAKDFLYDGSREIAVNANGNGVLDLREFWRHANMVGSIVVDVG